MTLTETIRIYPDKIQREVTCKEMNDYISLVNQLVSDFAGGRDRHITSKDIEADLPSAIKCQAARAALSIIKKFDKDCRKVIKRNKELEEGGSDIRIEKPKLPVLKKPCCIINNQNFKIKDGQIVFPVFMDGKCSRISVATKMTERQKTILGACKPGSLRIVKKNGHLTAQISVDLVPASPSGDGTVMGVDLGIKCPAVSYTSTGHIKFYGNGRANKYMRRHFSYLRKKAQKAKKLSVVKRTGNKEQRIMTDIDHKISRQIVNEAVKRNVSVIHLENLSGIRKSASKSRKNNRSLYAWSFYRLTGFIVYKAALMGIEVQFVNPAWTSQECPVCHTITKADDRHFACPCGFHTHRDILGAMNICRTSEILGNRVSA